MYLQFSQKTNEKKFNFTTMVPQLELFSFVFGRIEDTKKTFRNYLTFSKRRLKQLIFAKSLESFSRQVLYLNAFMQFYFLQLLTISLRQNKYLRTNKLGRSTVIDIAVVERALHTQGCWKQRGRGGGHCVLKQGFAWTFELILIKFQYFFYVLTDPKPISFT